jgi:hypothetical protein
MQSAANQSLSGSGLFFRFFDVCLAVLAPRERRDPGIERGRASQTLVHYLTENRIANWTGTGKDLGTNRVKAELIWGGNLNDHTMLLLSKLLCFC